MPEFEQVLEILVPVMFIESGIRRYPIRHWCTCPGKQERFAFRIHREIQFQFQDIIDASPLA